MLFIITLLPQEQRLVYIWSPILLRTYYHPFEGVDFDKGQIFDNGSIYKSTVNKNVHIYTASISYSYNKINTITAGIDSQTVISISNVRLSK